MIRYGVVGLGGFAAAWARALENLEARGVARMAAVTEIDRDLLAAQRDDLAARGVQIYSTVQEMLAQGHGSIDLIGLPVGIASHALLAVQAMEAGYNVLVEKPVTATVQDLARMQEAERRTGRWCAVDYQFMYSPTTQWVLDKLTGGVLGRLLEARVRISWPRPASYYVRNAWAGQLCRPDGVWVLDGPATNATAHYLMQVLYWAALGQVEANPIAEVRAELYRAKPIPSYDTACIEARLANGVRVLNVTSHAVTRAMHPEALLLCERGQVHWFAPEERATVTYADGREETYVPEDDYEVHVRALGRVADVVAGREARPACGLREAGAQVWAINLAFESSRGVMQIPEEHLYQETAGDGSAAVAVCGLEDAMQQVYEEGAPLAKVGLPWTRSGEWVSAKGYEAFPTGAELKRWLGM